MRPSEQSYFATNRADFLKLATIGANLFMRYHLADDFFFHRMEDCANIFLGVGIIFGGEFLLECLDDFRFDFIECRLSCQLVGIANDFINLIRCKLANRLINLLVGLK